MYVHRMHLSVMEWSETYICSSQAPIIISPRLIREKICTALGTPKVINGRLFKKILRFTLHNGTASKIAILIQY